LIYNVAIAVYVLSRDLKGYTVQIQIHGVDIPSTEAINEHTTKAVQHALHVFERQVTRVDVHLHDSNANKGGEDKRVVMEVHVAGFQPLAVEHTSADMYDSITQAGHKLQRMVKHKIERHEAHKSSH